MSLNISKNIHKHKMFRVIILKLHQTWEGLFVPVTGTEIFKFCNTFLCALFVFATIQKAI